MSDAKSDVTPDVTSTADQKRDRSRLIDHFKRVYSIVAGLAITEACKQLWPFSSSSFLDYRFWMFAAFFVSIVPIFHGGDRSLDHKYLDARIETRAQRFSYIWDVYMLLLTAILFVGIAEAIPKRDATVEDPASFFAFLSVLFIFDALVLIVDFVKSAQKDRLRAYPKWIFMNTAMSLIAVAAVAILRRYGDAEIELLGAATSSVFVVSVGVFACAALRSFCDYWFSDEFMFP